jgi:prevent-host-death family protein
MRSYPLNEARSQLSTLIDRALAGEPQRVTRHGKDAVVIVSEAEWAKQSEKTSTLADLLLDTIGKGGVADAIGNRTWYKSERPLGVDFTD